VLIIDTAGRLHVDSNMMDEIKTIHKIAKPTETLFVVDSMTGQDAANTAKAFNDALPLTGIVLTKTDGDARGGAALSIRDITGKPIKFLGVGEKINALEAFYPDRIASSILGMGDMLTLIEELEQNTEQEKVRKLTKKVRSGKNFDLNDFKMQLGQMHKMGGVGSILKKLPNMPAANMAGGDDKKFNKNEAIIDSMTPQERTKPEIMKSSRKIRVAKGSGTTVQDINRLLKQFTQMRKMMKKFMGKKGGTANMMKQMQQLGGGMPGMGSLRRR